jgi:hypothetical protein
VTTLPRAVHWATPYKFPQYNETNEPLSNGRPTNHGHGHRPAKILARDIHAVEGYRRRVLAADQRQIHYGTTNPDKGKAPLKGGFFPIADGPLTNSCRTFLQDYMIKSLKPRRFYLWIYQV